MPSSNVVDLCYANSITFPLKGKSTKDYHEIIEDNLIRALLAVSSIKAAIRQELNTDVRDFIGV
jgi:hypothetical protein